MAPKTNIDALKQYIDAKWQLIPLHSYDYFDQHKGKKRERGKSPLHSNWTKRPYKSKEQIKHLASGNNVGVRLRATDLVIDVDPRNFVEGDDPLRRLCEDTGLNLDNFPHVITGSGGDHFYMTKPVDVSVRDTLEGYRGIEFKTIGRQVVSAGSIHPTTKATYEWDALDGPPLRDAPPAPDKLINVVRRPAGNKTTSGGGEYSQEEVAQMLDALDPEDYRDHDTWLTLMMACHHASGGDARTEFVEWSTRDPEFSDEGTSIGRRWDSLHSARGDGPTVTHRTLIKALTDGGHEDAIPRTSAEDDFDDDPDVPPDEDNGEPEHERLGPIERMNVNHVAVMFGNKFRIMYREMDWDAPTPREVWRSMAPYDFRQKFANKKLQRDGKVIGLPDAWLESGKRRSADQVIFDPEHDRPNCLNLWTGWAVEPVKGDWSLLQEMLHEALCDGDDAVYKYVLDWSAYMVQHPSQPAEVALCFQGAKGGGKGTFCRALKNLAGAHGIAITASKQMTGQFNSHLRECILLFADEAVNPYDKQAEGMLKSIITEPQLAYEPKGVDLRMGRNHIHLVMASNDDWFVPMSLEGERRFMTQRINASWVGHFGRFKELNAQMDREGGQAAMLWDLLNRDLKGWAPRSGIPQTAASREQKIRSLSPIGGWWFNALCDGEFPGEVLRNGEWYLEPIRIFKSDMRASFEAHCHSIGVKPGSSGRGLDMLFAKELTKLCPGMRSKLREPVPEDRPDIVASSDDRALAVELPALDECRANMERLLGGPVDW
ncbi:MAG: bifunctional DNA primase/polymerase [Nitrospiraceae bacterium]